MKRLKKLISFFFVLGIFFFFSQDYAYGERVFLVKIEGPITPITANFLIYALKFSEEKKAKAFIVELDTPGGLVESTREIVKEFLQSEIPIIVYVSPSGARAASAGFFILLGSHLAAMAPSTHLGAAHPVELTGKADSKMLEKIANDLSAWAKSLAETRGRNPAFAEEAVKKSKTLTEKEALSKGVIEIMAKDIDELLEKAEGRKVKIRDKDLVLYLKGAKLEIVKEDLKTRFFKILANPNLVYFLLMLGLLGLYFELSHPGTIFPGVLGAICLILAFLGLSILPMNYAGLALIFLSALFFFLETQFTSHGLLALAGVISLFLGSLLLFGSNPPSLKTSYPFLLSVVLTSSFLFGGITYLAIKTLRKKPISGESALIGKKGKALTEISPYGGKVFVEGEIWQAISEEEIPKESLVEILEKKGFTLKVKAIKPPFS